MAVEAGFTTCATSAELDAAKLPEATNDAFKLCVPADSAAVLKVAKPPDRVPDPSSETPSKKLTVPVGAPPVDETVAVKVRLSLKAEGFGEDDKVVVVGARFTVCVSTEDVEPAKSVEAT